MYFLSHNRTQTPYVCCVCRIIFVPRYIGGNRFPVAFHRNVRNDGAETPEIYFFWGGLVYTIRISYNTRVWWVRSGVRLFCHCRRPDIMKSA